MEQVMSKVLKKEEPAEYQGHPIVLRPISYTDDLIISGSIAQIEQMARENGLTKEITDNLVNVAALLGTIKFSAFNQDGTPVFKTLQAIHEAIRTPEAMTEINALYLQYINALELTREEKKS